MLEAFWIIHIDTRMGKVLAATSPLASDVVGFPQSPEDSTADLYAGRQRGHLLMVIGTPTWETSVTVIWKSWYRSLKPFRSHGVSATA